MQTYTCSQCNQVIGGKTQDGTNKYSFGSYGNLNGQNLYNVELITPLEEMIIILINSPLRKEVFVKVAYTA